MKVFRLQTLALFLLCFSLPACSSSNGPPAEKVQQITVTTVESKPVTLTQRYHGQLRSHRNVEVRAPESGILQAVQVKLGQTVKQNDLLFQIKRVADKERSNINSDEQIVSIRAAIDGTVDRLPSQQDSVVLKGESLLSLSDDSVMWIYFNIPEAAYLDYKTATSSPNKGELKIELMLPNGETFDQPGNIGAIGSGFNSLTGSIPFRADFPNPNGLLRHGQSAMVLISRVLNDALVIPQQATFQYLEKRYVFLIDKDDVVHRHEIAIDNEVGDLFIVRTGLKVHDKIVVEGIRQIHDGEKVTYNHREAKKVIANVSASAQ